MQPQQKREGVKSAACAECTRVPLGIGPQLEPHIPQHPLLSLGSWQNQLALNHSPHTHFCQLANLLVNLELPSSHLPRLFFVFFQAASTDLPSKKLREVKRVSVYLHHRALQMPAGVMHQGGCHHRIHWQLEICRKMSSGRPFGCHGVTPGHLDLFPP